MDQTSRTRRSREIGRKNGLPVLAAFTLLVGSAGASGSELVANGGFETGSPFVHPFDTIPGPGSNVPNELEGGWGHNDGTVFIGAEAGITPFDGTQMLKFETTGYPGPDFPTPGGAWESVAYSGVSSDIVQLIDLSSHSSLIQQGNAVLSASLRLNRIAGDPTSDNRHRLSLWPFFGPFGDLADPANAPVYEKLTYGDLYSDSDPGTWEELSLVISLPPGTTFVRLGISAVENVSPQTDYPEVEGHYADSVSAQVSVAPAVPIPTAARLVAALLVVLGSIVLRNKKRASAGL